MRAFKSLLGYIPGRIANLVDDTVLDLRFREYSLNSGGEACQMIRTGYEDVLYTAVSQAVKDSGPILGAFIFTYPYLTAHPN